MVTTEIYSYGDSSRITLDSLLMKNDFRFSTKTDDKNKAARPYNKKVVMHFMLKTEERQDGKAY